MSCDVANSSPFDMDDWQKPNANDLEPIREYNSQYDANHGSGNTIDPQMAFGNGSSQQDSHFDAAFNGMDQALNGDASAFSEFTDFGDQPSATPYFTSVESNASAFHQPPHLRSNQYHHRRSVSEPPTGPPQPQQQQPGPAVMFHRDNHFLGKPMGQKPVPLKSQYKNRPQRRPTHLRKQMGVYDPYPRPELRRSQTQPVHPQMAPTSAPVHHQMPSHPQYYSHHPQQQHPQHMMMQEPMHYVSSRVCTPTPDISSPHHQNIDPALSAPPTPVAMPTPQHARTSSNNVTIPLTVEELRNMIFEAVQKAIRAEESKVQVVEEDAGAAKYETPKVEEEREVDQDGGDQDDNIVVAQSDFDTIV